MRKILIASITLAFLFALSSCKPEGRIFEEHKKLSPDYEWFKKDIREFKVPIEDNSILYNLSLGFRFAQGYQYRVAKVNVTEISPSGVQTARQYSLRVRDENDKYIGDPGYDIWDSEHLIEPDLKYAETGIYTYVIEHAMPKDPLIFAMEIGVVLDKKLD